MTPAPKIPAEITRKARRKKIRQPRLAVNLAVNLLGIATHIIMSYMGIVTDAAKIEDLLTRGVSEVLPTKEGLAEVLRSGKRIKLYQGFDPTGTQLHIGHMVGFRKLRQFQDLGHQVIFLIGDGTGQAGDPSGKTKARDKFFTREELRANAVSYVKQASKIVNFEGENPIDLRFNGDWLNELKLLDVLEIAGHFSLQQLSERDMFQERMKKGETVNMREFLYPLLQGYDSVAMEVDLEVGGSDQTFNMLAGRTLLRAIKGKEKFVLSTPLLADSSGRKIGKSEGNVIALTDHPNDLFGKVMSLSDDVIVLALEYLTDIPTDKIKKIEDDIDGGANPMQFKKLLAYEIVKQLNEEKSAQDAQTSFENTFSRGETPADIMEIKHAAGTLLADALIGQGLVSSGNEFRRLIDEGAISIDGEKVTDYKTPTRVGVCKVGKHRFVKFV